LQKWRECDDRHNLQGSEPSSTNSPINSRKHGSQHVQAKPPGANVVPGRLRASKGQEQCRKSNDRQDRRPAKPLQGLSVQNTPNADSITPTANFSVFSEPAPADDARKARTCDQQTCRKCASTGWNEQPATRADSYNDENHFKSFEQDGLKNWLEQQANRAACCRPSLFAEFCRFDRESHSFVMQWNDAR